MTIAVEFFAGAAELAGVRRAEVIVSDNAKVVDLRRALVEQWPRLGSLLAKSTIAVEERQADDATQLHAGAVVAVLPPVSGG